LDLQGGQFLLQHGELFLAAAEDLRHMGDPCGARRREEALSVCNNPLALSHGQHEALARVLARLVCG
jgi:hypothetical protein